MTDLCAATIPIKTRYDTDETDNREGLISGLNCNCRACPGSLDQTFVDLIGEKVIISRSLAGFVLVGFRQTLMTNNRIMKLNPPEEER
jgi:hypothetical protein